MKKVIFFLVLIISFNTIANAQQDEIWEPVVTRSDLIGKWTGSHTIEIPQNDEAGIPNSALTFTINIDYLARNENIVLELMVDLNQLMNDWIKLPVIMELGITKEQFWNMIKQKLSAPMENDVTFSDNYQITFLINEEVEELINSEYYLINRNRTMLKVIFEDPLSLGLGDAGFSEMTLVKTR